MIRVNVHLDEQLNAALAREAARTGESKAALLRRAARILLDQRAAEAVDGWAAFTGAIDDAPTDDRHHDDVIYR
ncbi:MAG: ribbon-helix-helix domain-containing protein [Pseudonocardia sp.]|nr:ribbon-helix-helix domain-containing protein [Pseudonocardia sp.]